MQLVFFGGVPPLPRLPQRAAGGAVARRAYALVPCYGSTGRGVGLFASRSLRGRGVSPSPRLGRMLIRPYYPSRYIKQR